MRTAALLALIATTLACGSEPAAPPDASLPCGGACGAGTVCSEGRCVAEDAGADAAPEAASDAAPEATADAPACPAGFSECGPGTCVNTRTAAEHCGACGYRCPNGGTCVAGECRSASGLTCPLGNADCDNNQATGCEAQLRGDHTNCGRCGVNCRSSGMFCRDGTCAP